MTESDLFAVVTGGGTAGHVLPALAVAEGLQRRGHAPSAILYAGARRGVETKLVPPTAFPHVFYDVVGFQRRVTKANVAFVPKMVRASRAATRVLRERRAKVVVSVGGYASMPMVFAARRLGIPVVVVSFDKHPGKASVVAARKAAVCAVAFPDSPLPRAVVTGAPVRQAILDVDRLTQRDSARRALGVPADRFLVAVTGGSQGSGVLNEAVNAYVSAHADDPGLAVRHVVGDRFVADAAPARRDPAGILYDVIGYEDQMPLVYAAADLIVGRGGASTVTEVAVTASAAILSPWAASAEDHQTANVRWLSDVNAAVLLREGDLRESLGTHIESLRADPARRMAMAGRAAELGRPHRSGRLAEVVEMVAYGTSPLS